jgi:O-methyltransferase
MHNSEIIIYLTAFVRYQRLFSKYRPYTMIGRLRYLENLALAEVAISNPTNQIGAIIECGTWKGGMAAGLIEVGGPKRMYYFFDSFEGLPPAQEIDGERAVAYQANISAPEYANNCSATLEEFRATIALTKCRPPPENIEIRPGFFEQSFESFSVPPVVLLRLDADWYSSTMACLTKFWDFVLPGGLILIDDYYTWDGCAKAVHEFLTSKGATERVRQGRVGGVAFIRKEA